MVMDPAHEASLLLAEKGPEETLIEQVGETLPCVLVLGAGQGPWQGAGTLRSLGPPTPQGM